ncbi:hypothetical protein GXB81_03555 [Paraburkholderia sp. Ac-20336]|uniref:hypothetical protein n=1 Tax=unclassified Paraburkholderia TaxID=2615204 RepID=UPI0014222F51|nr:MULTISPECIES: hypothetical protein [unclassified Paraburkholderia]MBN3802135.1 hypothetical protein [Paraburkholderia sp. Ac-20336]MBN3848586.1 hypothetical protein [Paraburkholderia sp. Ac-20342]NIF76110.1 hypothetical protein [Paraburkholderia sp. Cy-641]
MTVRQIETAIAQVEDQPFFPAFAYRRNQSMKAAALRATRHASRSAFQCQQARMVFVEGLAQAAGRARGRSHGVAVGERLVGEGAADAACGFRAEPDPRMGW